MKYLFISLLLLVAVKGSGQFLQESTYSYKNGNGCCIVPITQFRCGCNCYTYDFEQQIRRVADAYDTTVFNNAEPANDWKTADFPEAWDTDLRDSLSFISKFSLDYNDSSERYIIVPKYSDTSTIVPLSISFKINVSDQQSTIYDDGEGRLLCTTEGVLHTDSYVDYSKKVIKLKFLVAVEPYRILGSTKDYNFNIKILHYHDRPPGYYVLFMRNKQTKSINKIGFVVEANTLIAFP